MMSDSAAFDPDVNEKYVDEAKSAADEYAADGLTELELCAQYCRSCTVSVQRHFHVRSLGEVCRRAMRVGEEAFPLDLVEELAQDDDGDVRQLVAEQLGVLAEALRESRARQEDEVYTGLLCVAFLLVEDDVDGVVSAAEDAVASVAGLLEGHDARELLLTQIANLATCEEEEIRVSGAKILGSLAAVLGPEVSASRLAPLLVTFAGDEQFQIREATTRAVAAVGAAARNEDAESTFETAFRALARDDVWSVRRAVAETLTSMSACLSSGAFEALVADLFEPLANDVSYQVRVAMLENLGPLISALGGERASASLVDHFVSAARAESGQSSGTSGGSLQLACAFNLPGVALAIGRARWHEIREAHATLADSVQWRVRRTVACSLHEVAKILGGDAADADLSPIFEETLKDTDEVRFGAVSNLAAFVREIPPEKRKRHLRSIAGIAESQNARGDAVGNWRLRCALALQLDALSEIVSQRDNEEIVLPLALRLLRDPAHAVRAKAVGCIGAVLRNTARGPAATWREGVCGKTVSDLKRMATNPGWMDRQAYVQMCGAFSAQVDPRVVIEELVPLLVMSADDAVPNVRRELAATIATLQANPSFAALPDLRDAVARLRDDHDGDVARTARGCAFEDRGGMGRTGLTVLEFAPTGLRSPLR
mmetsp:Transcript_15407/g.64980  ORF Transcript_15407/g.64980 Transcript_15407/m.64980 type:complete len:657 (-) Transcript_15407:80-2050(-)